MLTSSSTWLRQRYGLDVDVVAIADRSGAAVSRKGIDLHKALYAKNKDGSVSTLNEIGRPHVSALAVLEEIAADIVVEVTSTNFQTGEPGITHIRKALSQGNHVVTTNKGSLAASFQQLTNLAERSQVSLSFGGAVGGALPVLDFAKKCLLSEEIESIRGVLNGTTNHILWSMAEKEIGMPQAIEEAQELGYAEENIHYDLEGLDTACKLVILANWIMDRKVSLKEVETRGIREISLEEILCARDEGFPIRLIGSIGKRLKVSPEKISSTDPLCVGRASNVVEFNCARSGQHLLIGRGAGGNETASSIIRDIVRISQENHSSSLGKDWGFSLLSKGADHCSSSGGIA
jgi:homoserine dehydrogenase